MPTLLTWPLIHVLLITNTYAKYKYSLFMRSKAQNIMQEDSLSQVMFLTDELSRVDEIQQYECHYHGQQNIMNMRINQLGIRNI